VSISQRVGHCARHNITSAEISLIFAILFFNLVVSTRSFASPTITPPGVPFGVHSCPFRRHPQADKWLHWCVRMLGTQGCSQLRVVRGPSQKVVGPHASAACAAPLDCIGRTMQLMCFRLSRLYRLVATVQSSGCVWPDGCASWLHPQHSC
jgi:hypothetical protein